MKHVPGTLPDPRRGEWLVQTRGYDQERLIDKGDVGEYLKEQRALVERRGYCGDGCTELIAHYATGASVCRRTLQPCPSVMLRFLLEAYSEV